jgi:hypothetical protein
MKSLHATSVLTLLLAGIGEKKVKRLYQALHTPFKKKKMRTDDREAVTGSSTADDPWVSSRSSSLVGCAGEEGGNVQDPDDNDEVS